MARRKPRILLPDKRKVVRRLKFDSLEDRKLLAGLSVFVFEDANGSGKLDSVELGAEGRVVFLDQDRDGRLDPSEAWALTDRLGRASFDGLAPGDYWPVLFGANPASSGPLRCRMHHRGNSTWPSRPRKSSRSKPTTRFGSKPKQDFSWSICPMSQLCEKLRSIVRFKMLWSLEKMPGYS